MQKRNENFNIITHIQLENLMGYDIMQCYHMFIIKEYQTSRRIVLYLMRFIN